MPYALRQPGRRKYGRHAARPVPELITRVALLDRPEGKRDPAAQPAEGGPDGTTVGRGRWLPVGALLLALIQVFEGAWLVAALGGFRVASQGGLPAELLTLGVPGQYAIIVVAAFRFVAALGLLTRHRAAWVTVMLVTGVGLAATLSGYLIDRPDDIRLFLGVASAFYLNQPGVRAVFGVREQAR